MRNNRLTLVVGVILVVVFFLLLFTFQVRQNEVVMVTTFDRPTRPVTDPGLKFKWPYPIQKVYRFDKRSQSFEDDFEETLTRDNYNLLAMVYVGWNVSDVEQFFKSFPAATRVIANRVAVMFHAHTGVEIRQMIKGARTPNGRAARSIQTKKEDAGFSI